MPWPSKKLMLTIGVGTYQEFPQRLMQPPNEARKMKAVLYGLGFRGAVLRTSIEGEEPIPQACTTENMRRHINELLDDTIKEPGALAFFYYSGHGLMYGNKHYLLPSDYKTGASAPKLGGAVCVEDDLIEVIQNRDCAAIIMLDCCRNEPSGMKGAPVPADWGGFQLLSADTKDASGHNPGASIQVIYSCGPGRTATAGGGASMSPFTAAVVEKLSTPGKLFQHIVNEAVAAARSRGQSPQSKMLGDPQNRLTDLVLAPIDPVPAPEQPPTVPADPEDEHMRAVEVDPGDVSQAANMLLDVLTGPANTPIKLDLKGCTVKVKLPDGEQDLRVTHRRVEVHNCVLYMPSGASLIVAAADVRLCGVHIRGCSTTPLNAAVTPRVGQTPGYLPSEQHWFTKNDQDKQDRQAGKGLVYVIEGGNITMDGCKVSYEPWKEHQNPCHGMVVEAGGAARLMGCTLSQAPGCGLLARHRQLQPGQRQQGEQHMAVVKAQRTTCELNKGMGFCAYGSGAELTAGEGCKAVGNHNTGFVALDGGKLRAAGGCEARGSTDGGGFLACGQDAQLIAGEACLAEENQRSGFAACLGGELLAHARCKALRSKQNCGFIADGTGSHLFAKAGCIADSNDASGFHAVYGGQLTTCDDCRAVNNSHHGFSAECDGSKLTAGERSTARTNHLTGFAAIQGGTLIAEAGCKAVENGSGFMAYWCARLTVGDGCEADGNHEAGFQAAFGGHLTARDKCKAINSPKGYGFFAYDRHKGKSSFLEVGEEWANGRHGDNSSTTLEVGEQCLAEANQQSGFAAVGGARLTMRRGCRANSSRTGYGFYAEGAGSVVQLGEGCSATQNRRGKLNEVGWGRVKTPTPGRGCSIA